jgi:hypothetical protein
MRARESGRLRLPESASGRAVPRALPGLARFRSAARRRRGCCPTGLPRPFRAHLPEAGDLQLLAESLVTQLAGQGAAWIIAPYHGPVKEAAALARKVRGMDLIIVGGEQKLMPPRKIGGALLVSPGEEGNRVGHLELSRDERGRVRHAHRFQLFQYGIDPGDPSVLKRIKRLREEPGE